MRYQNKTDNCSPALRVSRARSNLHALSLSFSRSLRTLHLATWVSVCVCVLECSLGFWHGRLGTCWLHHLTHIQEQRLVIVIDSSAKQISAHSIWLGQFYKLPLIDLHLQSSCSCKRTAGNRIIGIKNICDARNALLNYLRVPCGQQFESHCAQLYTKQIWRQMPQLNALSLCLVSFGCRQQQHEHCRTRRRIRASHCRSWGTSCALRTNEASCPGDGH